MKTVLVRYKTAPEHAEENARLVRAVYAELAQVAPPGFHYATFRFPDGVSFVHYATRLDADRNVLVSLPSFQAFQQGLRERCVEPPVVSEVSVVGSYAFFPLGDVEAA